MQSKRLICMLISLSIILTSFIGVITVDADSNDALAEFASFKSCWSGDGENKYFKITDSMLDGSSNGAIAYAGTAALTEKLAVSIDWALTNANTADVSVYAMPLIDTDGDGAATAAETDEYYTSNIDTNGISSNPAPNLSEGALIANLLSYTGESADWDFATLNLDTQYPAPGEKAIFIQTTHRSGTNGLTGNFRNLVIKKGSESGQTPEPSPSAQPTATSAPVYDYDAIYDIGGGTVITSTQMYEDGFIESGSKNVQYDAGSDKQGVITFETDSEDIRTAAVTAIFGTEHKYEGVIDYAGTGKGKNAFTLPINITTEDNYYAYVLTPRTRDIYMWVDTPNASIANSASEAATPAFTVEGLDESGYVYAIDCGTLTAGSHTLTFDGAAGNWLPDICAVGIYPTDPTEFLYPYQNEELSFEERAADLVSRMTLEEKCAQLGHNAPAIPRLGVHEYYYWREGAHGVVDQGKATSFPVSLSISNSWDPEMYNREAEIISTEARVKNNQYDLNYWSPTINMARDPRWARNNETFGEDPYLTSQFGTAFVNGMQGDDEKYLKTISTLKHFLANNCEYERQTGSSEMDEQTLRDYYSKAFKTVVQDASPGAVMSSYNATTVTRNGEKLWDYLAQPANGNILTDLLRSNWGFDGFVTGDCGAIGCLNGEAFKRSLFPDAEKLSDVPQSATVAKAIQAGNELDCGNVSTKYAMEAVELGYLSEDEIERALYRVFLQRFKTGEFDNTDVYRNYTEENDLETDENVAVALEAAEKGIVMLQNTEDENGETLLPLNNDGDLNIALIGEMASQTYIGDYSGTPTKNVSPYDGLKQEFGEDNVHFLGHAEDDDVLFNIRSITLILTDGSERAVDLSKPEEVSGMEVSGGSLLNITPKASAVIRDVNFENVATVRAEIATGPDSPGGTLIVGYDNASRIESQVDAKSTTSLDDYAVCEGSYNGADGDYDGVADMYLTFSADSTFTVEKYKQYLDEADVIIAYSSTMVGNAEPETGEVADGHESNDRTTISLPYRDRHVSEICNAQDESGEYLYSDKTVVVMHTVGQVDVQPFKDRCRAMLWSSYNGQRQGEALANVLSGDVNPSGKLTTTWYDPDDLEIMQCGGVHTTDEENITWKRNDYGIRQRYDESGACTRPGRTYMYYNGTPEYPFGYGLSYTTFEYSNLRLDKTDVDANGSLKASIDITNTGNVDGTEIAQLYVHNENGDGINLPLQQLAGFARVDLKAGETKTIELEVNIADLAQYSESLVKNYVPTGEYTLWIGGNVTDRKNEAVFNVSGELASNVKTVYAAPSGITVKGAYDAEKNSTESINSITSETSVVMTDEEVIDMSAVEVIYSSADPSVAVVDQNGAITAGVKEGATTISVSATVNGETKTTSFPVVCELQTAIPDSVRQSYLDALDAAYAEYNQTDYRDKFWTELTEIYNNAKQAIENELEEANLNVILTNAQNDMSAVRSTIKPGEMSYSVSIQPDWYWNADVTVKYLGDEDEPYADVIMAVYDEDGTLKNTVIESCTARIDGDYTYRLENLDENDTVKCYVWQTVESMIPMSEVAEQTVTRPPDHVEYDLNDDAYSRLSALPSGEYFEEVNGFGGYGNFNDISNVNYTYDYNGKTYTLTGGFQGGKGNYNKSCMYFVPFDCYEKATVTAIFSSAGADRKLTIKQKDASGNEIVYEEAGGVHDKTMCSVTAEITDLTQPVYIMPTVKESAYMIIVDYEGYKGKPDNPALAAGEDRTLNPDDFDLSDMIFEDAAKDEDVLYASEGGIELKISPDGIIERTMNKTTDTLDYNANYGADVSFIKLDTWNGGFIALTEDNESGKRELITSVMGTQWSRPGYIFADSDIAITGNEEFFVNDYVVVGDQVYAGCDGGLMIVLTPCSKCYKLKSVCDFDITELSVENGVLNINGSSDAVQISLDELRQTNISVEEALDLANDGAKLIDVRSPEEFSQYSYENSINIPIDEIGDIFKYDKDETLIFYCSGGGRAQKAVEYAQENGYTNVYNLGSVSYLANN